MLPPSILAIIATCALLVSAQTPSSPAPSTTPTSNGGTSPSLSNSNSSGGPSPTASSANGPAVTSSPVGQLILPNFTKIDAKDGMPKAKVCSSDKSVCITITDLGDAIDVMAEAPAEAKWLGVGWGTGMPQADIVVGYVVNKQFVVSDRKASAGKSPPPVDNQQDALALGGGKDILPGKWVSHFQRMKKTGDSNDTEVDLNSPVNMIYAYHTTTGVTVPNTGSNPELRATLTKHTNQGKLVLDMKDQTQVAAAKQSTPTTTTNTSGSSSIVESSYILIVSFFAILLSFA